MQPTPSDIARLMSRFPGNPGLSRFPTSGGKVRIGVDPAGTHADYQPPNAFSSWPDQPPMVTANQNDFFVGETSWLKLKTDASRNFTGFAGGSEGRHLVIENVGNQPFTIQNLNSGSQKWNQVQTNGGADVQLTPNARAWLLYDMNIPAWRLVPFGAVSAISVREITPITSAATPVDYDFAGNILSVAGVSIPGLSSGEFTNLGPYLLPAVINEDYLDAQSQIALGSNIPPVKVLSSNGQAPAGNPLGLQIFTVGTPAGGQTPCTFWGGGNSSAITELTGLIEIGDWVFVRGLTGPTVPPAYQVELVQVVATDQSAWGYARISGGQVAGVSVPQAGTYNVAPTVVFEGGGGTGAIATATLDGGGHVNGVTITAGGSGYTSVPVVLFEGPRKNPDAAIELFLGNTYTAGVEILWPPAFLDFLNDQDYESYPFGEGLDGYGTSSIPRSDIYQLTTIGEGVSYYVGETYLARQAASPSLSPVQLFHAERVRTPGGTTLSWGVTITAANPGPPASFTPASLFLGANDPEGYYQPLPTRPDLGATLVIPADGWYSITVFVTNPSGVGTLNFALNTVNMGGGPASIVQSSTESVFGFSGPWVFTTVVYLLAQTVMQPVLGPNLQATEPWNPPLANDTTNQQSYSGYVTIKGLGPGPNPGLLVGSGIVPWDANGF